MSRIILFFAIGITSQPNLNPNQKATQLQASCGFETSKLQCSTTTTNISYCKKQPPAVAYRNQIDFYTTYCAPSAKLKLKEN